MLEHPAEVQRQQEAQQQLIQKRDWFLNNLLNLTGSTLQDYQVLLF